jgi:hypothetical protein
MDRVSLWRDARMADGKERKHDLRNQLVNLTMDWELAALTLDAQRYKTQGPLEKESLRDTANTYRKCIAELSEILSCSPMLAAKTD